MAVSVRVRLAETLSGPSFFSRVLRSFLTLAAGEGAARAIGFVAQLILIRTLDPGPYGLVTLGISLVGWFALVVDSGTESLNVREISREPERFRELADPVLGLRIALSLGAAVALALGTYFLASSPGSRDVLPRFALILPMVAVNLRWMVLGIREARAVALGNVASRIIFVLTLALFVTAPHEAGRVPYLEAVSEATYALVILALVARRFGVPRPRIDLSAWRETLTQGFPLLVYGACRATILTLDVILIALILGHPQAGFYGAALKPVAFFLGAIGLFSVSFLSGYSAAPDGETTSLFRRATMLGAVSMGLVAGALTLGAPLVTYVFGHKFASSAAPLAVLAWTIPLSAVGVPYGAVLIARGRQSLLMRNNIAAATFSVAANAAVIPSLGITGSAGVRVATYALLLVLNQRTCVSRGFAPSLGAILGRRRRGPEPRHAPAGSSGVPPDYYRRLHEVDSTHWWHRGMRQIEAALLAGRLDRDGLSLLDAGCGTGGFLAWAADRGGFARLCGVDASPEAIELARAVAPSAELRVARLERLPFPDGSFDVVVLEDVLQHVDEATLDAALAELRRVLRGDGVMVVRTNGARHARRERADWRAYDARSLGDELRRNGFRVVRLTHANVGFSLVAACLGRVPQAPSSETHGIPAPDGRVKSALGRLLLALEAAYLSRPGRSLPYGHNLLAVVTPEGHDR